MNSFLRPIATRIFGILILVLGFLVPIESQPVEAQGISIHIGGGSYRSYRPGYPSYHFGGYHSYTPSYYSRYQSFGPRYQSYYGGYYGYGGRYQSYYHPPYPHLDYHPPVVVPHGNHLDLIPGHYDLHYGHHH